MLISELYCCDWSVTKRCPSHVLYVLRVNDNVFVLCRLDQEQHASSFREVIATIEYSGHTAMTTSGDGRQYAGRCELALELDYR